MVKIIPEKKYPFKIVGSNTANTKNIRFTLEETKMSEGKGYILNIENLKKDQGRYYDMIALKTDSKIKPIITIAVYGNILVPKQSRNNRSL